MTFGFLSRAIQLIANDIAKVNFLHVKYDKNGKRENIDSDFTYLLNKKPSNLLTSWEFKKQLVWNLLLYGYCPILKSYDDSGKLIELYPLFPPWLTKKIESNTVTYILKSPDVNREIILQEDDVIWLEYESINGFEDISIRSLFKSTLSKVKENELSLMNAIKNDLSYSLAIKVKNVTDKDQKIAAENALRDMISRQKQTGSIGVVIDEKWDITPASNVINTRLDFTTRNSLGRELAAMLGIPPSKLGIDEDNKYNFSAALNASYADNALKPLLLNICQKLTYSFLESSGNEEISYRSLDLISMDTKSIQDFASSAINNGYATPNEIRQLIGLDPHMDGDHLLINSTLLPISLNIAKNQQENSATQNTNLQGVKNE